MKNGVAVSRKLEPHRHAGSAPRAAKFGGQGQPTTASRARGVARQKSLYAGMSLLMMFAAGCAAFHPLDGIPADCLPPELNQAYRSSQQTIDLSLLGQTPSRDYRVDSGDILAVYIQGVLGGGERTEAPPVMFQPDPRYLSSAGYPIQVRGNGTISLPLVKPISVQGMTLTEVEDLIRKTYTEDNKILQPNREHILVSLQQPRMYRVLVLRDEQVTPRQNSQTTFGYTSTEPTKRGQVVELRASENDVLHALAATGGLPNLDAENAVYIIRQNRNVAGNVPPAPQALKNPWTQQSKNAKKPSVDIAALMAKKDDKNGVKNALRLIGNSNETAAREPSPGDAWWRTSEPTLRHRVEEFWKVSSQISKPMLKQPTEEAWWDEKPGSRAKSSANGTRRSKDSIQTMSGERVVQTDAWWAAPGAADEDQMPVSEGRVTAGPVTFQTDDATILNPRILRIPVRLTPGEQANFNPEDVVLQDGDVVFIEAREDEFFYTSGLLGGGQYPLPRDYDLDLLGALSIVQSQVNTAHHGRTRNVGGMSVLNQDVAVGASRVIIRRKTCDNKVISVEVNLNKTVRAPENRIFIQPGDYVILEYTKPEAVAAWTERFVLEPFLSAVSFGALKTN